MMLGTHHPDRLRVFSHGDHRRQDPMFTPLALREVYNGLASVRERYGATVPDLARVALRYALARDPAAPVLVGFRDAEHQHHDHESRRTADRRRNHLVAPIARTTPRRVRRPDGETHTYETPVDDVEALRRTLLALDFTKLVTVDKTREEWTIPGEVVIAFDSVAYAGHFVEFEFKGEAESAEEAIARLQEFIDGLDVRLGDRINRGYLHMLLGRER